MKPIVIHTSLESHICNIKLCYQPQCASVSQNLWRGCLIYTEIFCHALSLSLADSHGKATTEVKILLCLSGYKIIVAFRAGRYLSLLLGKVALSGCLL